MVRSSALGLTLLVCLQSFSFIILIIHYGRTPTVFHIKPTNISGKISCARNQLDKATVFKEIPLRGSLSNCSLDDIRKKPRVMLLSTINLAFLDVALNMLESIKRTRVCVNATIFAEDKKVYEYLIKITKSDPAVHVLKTDFNTDDKEVKRRNAVEYYRRMNKRYEYILDFLEQGFEVLFADTDTVWLRDPFPYLQGDFDMAMTDFSSTPRANKTRKDMYFCNGFAYFKPTNTTLWFVKTWVTKNPRGRSGQSLMNALLRKDNPVHVNVRPLDQNIFPVGRNWRNSEWLKGNFTMVVAHASDIAGHDSKLTFLRKYNMWFLNTTVNGTGLVAL